MFNFFLNLTEMHFEKQRSLDAITRQINSCKEQFSIEIKKKNGFNTLKNILARIRKLENQFVEVKKML